MKEGEEERERKGEGSRREEAGGRATGERGR